MKNKIKNILNNINDVVIIDSLVVVSVIIIITTTILLNIYIGMYLLSLALFGLAVIISRYKGRR